MTKYVGEKFKKYKIRDRMSNAKVTDANVMGMTSQNDKYKCSGQIRHVKGISRCHLCFST